MGKRENGNRCSHIKLLESETPMNATLVSVPHPLFPINSFNKYLVPGLGIHAVLDSGEPSKVLPLMEFMF